MRLDRTKGNGKYAVINRRKLAEYLDKCGPHASQTVESALALLHDADVLSYGDESQEAQFFVMRYPDKFTAPALRAYGNAVMQEAHNNLAKKDYSASLIEYCADVMRESDLAERIGCKTPD